MPNLYWYLPKPHLTIFPCHSKHHRVDTLKNTKEKYCRTLKDAMSLVSKKEITMYFESTLGLPLIKPGTHLTIVQLGSFPKCPTGGL